MGIRIKGVVQCITIIDSMAMRNKLINHFDENIEIILDCNK